jgi:hypothetical protein
MQSANSDLSAPDILMSSNGGALALATLVAGYSIMDACCPTTPSATSASRSWSPAAMTAGKITSAIVETTNSAGQYASAT